MVNICVFLPVRGVAFLSSGGINGHFVKTLDVWKCKRSMMVKRVHQICHDYSVDISRVPLLLGIHAGD